MTQINVSLLSFILYILSKICFCKHRDSTAVRIILYLKTAVNFKILDIKKFYSILMVKNIRDNK